MHRFVIAEKLVTAVAASFVFGTMTGALSNLRTIVDFNPILSTVPSTKTSTLIQFPSRHYFLSLQKKFQLSGKLKLRNSTIAKVGKRIKSLEFFLGELCEENLYFENYFLHNGEDESKTGPLDLTG